MTRIMLSLVIHTNKSVDSPVPPLFPHKPSRFNVGPFNTHPSLPPHTNAHTQRVSQVFGQVAADDDDDDDALPTLSMMLASRR